MDQELNRGPLGAEPTLLTMPRRCSSVGRACFKVPVYFNSTDVGSNHAQRRVIPLITPWHKVVGKS